MILRNPTSMSFLRSPEVPGDRLCGGTCNHRAGRRQQSKMSPSGEILAHILTMTFLITRAMHYVMNPKHDRLIGTVLLFATKKAKQQRMDLK